MEYRNNTTRFAFDDALNEEARICVVGVGGGGGNAVNNMITRGISGVDFITINTDSQALAANLATTKIQAGRELTKGLGAGARAEVGGAAVDESKKDIEKALAPYNMIFITAGMGGGTGTGGAPVVASIARQLGILTVAIVTKPFACEGPKRMRAAMAGIEKLREAVDTLLIIPNERLNDIAENESFLEAFMRVDDVLYNATKAISDLITVHGIVNLDFADVRTTMVDGGTALMGSAVASGENRAEKAAVEAISSPLLDGLSINGATNVLVYITASRKMGLREATAATSVIQREAGDDAELIFGTVIDENMGDEMRVTVIATGFDKRQKVVEPAQPAGRVRSEYNPVLNGAYKGPQNLQNLDEPAFIRREEQEGILPRKINLVGQHADMEENTAPVPRPRRLTGEENRKDRTGRDHMEVPTFLRKMLD